MGHAIRTGGRRDDRCVECLYSRRRRAATPAHSFLDEGAPSAAKHATRGTVKSINATTLVLTRPGKSDMTFELDPLLHREGTIDVGTMVSVRYHEDGARHIATAIAVDNHSRAE